jgi:hypothetical protein
MLEPGVVRFGLGPLTEVVAQRHTFAELAPHLDSTLLPVVAQERVLRGEDLRDDPRAQGETDDPPLVLQPFEPDYLLPEYRAAERLDGEAPEMTEGGALLRPSQRTPAGDAVPADAMALQRALEEVVAPWATQSGGTVRAVAVRGSAEASCHALLDGWEGLGGPDRSQGAQADVLAAGIDVPTLLQLVAFAGASGGVHGRRRGGAAGRAAAWWVARCATGLHREEVVEPEELEFRLEDLQLLRFQVPGPAAWRLEIALGRGEAGSGEEWAVAVAAFDTTQGTTQGTAQGTAQDTDQRADQPADQPKDPWG